MLSSEISIYIFLNLNNLNKTFFGDLTVQLQFFFLKIRIYLPLERSFIERNATGDIIPDMVSFCPKNIRPPCKITVQIVSLKMQK